MFKLSYRNKPASFVGSGRDLESPWLRYEKEISGKKPCVFAGQVMLAAGYFNTRLPLNNPKPG